MNSKLFGEKISALRKAKGLTQAQLAESLNVSNKTISRWETGEGYPEISLLMPLAKALGVTVDALLSDDEADANPYQSAEENSFSASSAYSGTYNKGKKEYKHRDIPVEWPGMPFRNLNINKFNVISNILHMTYFVVFTFLLIDASEYFQYTDKSFNSGLGNQHMGNFGSGDFLTGHTGSIWLMAMAAAFILLMLFNILSAAKEKMNTALIIRNIAITTVASLISVFFGLSFHTGQIEVNYITGLAKEKIYNFSDADIFTCDFIKLDSPVIAICGIAACVLFAGSELVRVFIAYRKNKKIKSEPRRSEYPALWHSLTIFNKIAFICVAVNIIVILLSILLILPFGYIPAFALMVVITPAIAKIGLISAIAGLVLGLFDVYDRQNGGAVVFIIINIIFVYILPFISAILAMTFGIAYTGAEQIISSVDVVEEVYNIPII
ncbi:MAG: helix-turn-helix domain-containing protein [Firmicutes bacterium]|nr:helix-turn-helix domain-containing protein [Bacillota bacterium]